MISADPGAAETLLAVFLEEAQRRVQAVDELLEALEQRSDANGGDLPGGLADALFVQAHTIKGSAALTALEDVRAAAADLEALACALRDGRATPAETLARGRTLLDEIRHRCSSMRAPSLSPAATTRREPAAGTTLRVLCVDDDAADRLVLERLLAQRPELLVLTARDGAAALELVRRQRPQLVLLDLNLPTVRGEEVLAALQADPQTHGIPVVVMSAEPAGERARGLLAGGAAGYLEKPLDLREVLAVVDGVAARAQR